MGASCRGLWRSSAPIDADVLAGGSCVCALHHGLLSRFDSFTGGDRLPSRCWFELGNCIAGLNWAVA